jgi:hypothetical protein
MSSAGRAGSSTVDENLTSSMIFARSTAGELRREALWTLFMHSELSPGPYHPI